MSNSYRTLLGVAVLAASAVVSSAVDSPFVGRWALDLPGNGAGYLKIQEMPGGYLDGSILWYAGSVVPVDSVTVTQIDGKDVLLVTRISHENRKDKEGKVIRTQTYVDLLTAQLPITENNKDALTFKRIEQNHQGTGFNIQEFTAKRMGAIPEAPDLSKVKFGEPIALFNGKNLDGWRLTSSGAANGWFAKDGVLVCDPKQEEGKPHKNYGNLRTDAEFEDFNLTLQAKVGPGGNSGVYLRGVCEIQVTDSYGKGLDSHHMGGLYSRITPSESAERPAGEWQDLDITYCQQHVTVKLNNKTIIDNQPVEGCTGGALWSDITKAGPIYLQGDHTGVEYKNIMLRPVVK